MSFTTLVFLCMIILTFTRVLDGTLYREGIKKSFLLFLLAVGFSSSVLPAFNVSRYVSLNFLFLLAVASYIYLLFKRRGTQESIRLAAFFLYILSLYILQLIWEITVNLSGFYYFEVGAVALYGILLIRRPGDGAVIAYFGVWFLQFLSIIKSIILDSYIYFDLSSAEVMQYSMYSALFVFVLSDILRYFGWRRQMKRAAVENTAEPELLDMQKR